MCTLKMLKTFFNILPQTSWAAIAFVSTNPNISPQSLSSKKVLSLFPHWPATPVQHEKNIELQVSCIFELLVINRCYNLIWIEHTWYFNVIFRTVSSYFGISIHLIIKRPTITIGTWRILYATKSSFLSYAYILAEIVIGYDLKLGKIYDFLTSDLVSDYKQKMKIVQNCSFEFYH